MIAESEGKATLGDFKKLELATAEILSVIPHPNADRLYILQIRVGGVTKQIVAGIRLHYSPEELQGKKIIVVNNLETAVIKGTESEGMLLAANDGSRLSLIVPERDISSGSRVA